jgi:hypothetical protein
MERSGTLPVATARRPTPSLPWGSPATVPGGIPIAATQRRVIRRTERRVRIFIDQPRREQPPVDSDEVSTLGYTPANRCGGRGRLGPPGVRGIRPMTDPMMALLAIALGTERIRFGTLLVRPAQPDPRNGVAADAGPAPADPDLGRWLLAGLAADATGRPLRRRVPAPPRFAPSPSIPARRPVEGPAAGGLQPVRRGTAKRGLSRSALVNLALRLQSARCGEHCHAAHTPAAGTASSHS